MDRMAFVETYRKQTIDAINAIDLAQVEQAIEWFREARAEGHMIFVAGNGGSAATASHLVCDLVKDVSYQRDLRFKAMALQDAIPTATAYSNDVDFTEGIAEQLRNFARPGDLYMALSGSGNSMNLVKGMECARAMGCKTLALTGRDGGPIGAAADIHVNVAEASTPRVQEVHRTAIHAMCTLVEQSLKAKS